MWEVSEHLTVPNWSQGRRRHSPNLRSFPPTMESSCPALGLQGRWSSPAKLRQSPLFPLDLLLQSRKFQHNWREVRTCRLEKLCLVFFLSQINHLVLVQWGAQIRQLLLSLLKTRTQLFSHLIQALYNYDWSIPILGSCSLVNLVTSSSLGIDLNFFTFLSAATESLV